MLRRVVVLGAGSAGLLAAISVKKFAPPHVTVEVVRSPDLGVIGVGESTTATFPKFVFEFLQISPEHFYKVANPTWKLGVHFEWGPRRFFHYGFEPAIDAGTPGLNRPNGFYCEDGFEYVTVNNALMTEHKAFASQEPGRLTIPPWVAFHLYNPTLVAALEVTARELGVTFVDGRVRGVVRGPAGVDAIVLEDERRISGDLFIDASGFRSELLGRALEEPFVSYDNSLFCDRAVIGGWDNTGDPILPYTVAETMNAGWCWRIDHEHVANRGYVFSSRFLSDDEARAEFVRNNPRAKVAESVIRFRSGRYRRAWVDNVVALGNAAGFVEPLEASALMILTGNCRLLVDCLRQSEGEPTETVRGVYNKLFAEGWDDVRDFLAIHYRYNTRLDTPFWRACQNEVDVSGSLAMREFYEENGPMRLGRFLLNKTPGIDNPFGIEGYLTILLGNKVPFRKRYAASDAENAICAARNAANRATALQGIDAREALARIRHPTWRWDSQAPR
jgi:tryptophan halogenase